MSRYTGRETAEKPRPTDDDFPSIVQHKGVVEYCRERRNVIVTEFLAKRAAESKPPKLPYSIVSGRRCFAPSDVDAWLLSLKKSNDRKDVSA